MKDSKLPGIFRDINFLKYVYTMLNYGQLVETKDHWQPWLPYLFTFMDTWETITKGTVIQYVPMCLEMWYTFLCELRGGRKENFYCHNSITLGQKICDAYHLSIFIWQHRKRYKKKKKCCFDFVKEIYFLICNTTDTLGE